MPQRAIWHRPKEWLSRIWEFALIQWISDKGRLTSEQCSNDLHACTKTTEKQTCQISYVHFDGIAHLIEVAINILFPWAPAISADLDRVIIRDGSHHLAGYWFIVCQGFDVTSHGVLRIRWCGNPLELWFSFSHSSVGHLRITDRLD